MNVHKVSKGIYHDKDIAIECLRVAGCKCSKPLLGYTPFVGVRCRLCNTQHEAENELRKTSNIAQVSDAVRKLNDYGISVDDYKELSFAWFEERSGWLNNED